MLLTKLADMIEETTDNNTIKEENDNKQLKKRQGWRFFCFFYENVAECQSSFAINLISEMNGEQVTLIMMCLKVICCI
ncbi:hypothetical protein KHA80_20500 [Anaerobacillus sp. HL2]|nr:hypothetical protein KHA80_20500 [Anaerobacillus sp. HL2]